MILMLWFQQFLKWGTNCSTISLSQILTCFKILFLFMPSNNLVIHNTVETFCGNLISRTTPTL
jgi:hypothetical protein